MRLHTIRLQNYRRHRDLTVDFSDQRVLVSGPNESGKSTLVEAIHRCLFYRHKSKAAGLLDRMQPRSGGDPEVTLVFSLGAIRYTLAKKFRGPSGSRAVLTDSQGRRDEGDAAEEALQQLLGINEVRGQLADAFNAQWAHLWVWQGSAHDEPGAALSESTTRQLRQQLQQQKGLGIIASRIDEAVQTAFQKRAEEIVGKAGKPKRSSRLGQAEQRLEAATHAVAAAAQQATGVRDAIDRLARADETITLSMGRKEEAESCLEPLRERIAEVDRLESVAARQQQDLEQACRKLEQLEATDTEIRTLAEELANLDRQLAPDEQRLAAAKADVATKASAAVAAYEALAGVRRELATLQDQRELFAAERIVLQANRELAALTELVERVEKAQETIDSLTRQLDEIPAVDEAAITALAAQEEQLKRSRLRVDLMATRIEVLAAEREVRLGDELLPTGTSSTISDVTELVIDATTRLLITPGGADSLADATQALASAEHELRRSLADHGVASLQAASLAGGISCFRLISGNERSPHCWEPTAESRSWSISGKADGSSRRLRRRRLPCEPARKVSQPRRHRRVSSSSQTWNVRSSLPIGSCRARFGNTSMPGSKPPKRPRRQST
jgi:DNA repair exonuclease SbcCD ATPase subunit